ncbi:MULTISPECIES: TonB-dependent siderophore receptor [unclassified Rhizobium]|uniref:TonB-dependent siderophore receptor n=1 Tax=unclassified Rhizobium TaxID=2613769 RepID=UPI0010464E17|nr:MULTISPECIES: TonB-dependent siderophore receptor [unclassified Rhizobium]MBB4166512.1 iron complex outermembrane receptor protein [Rhizobium sp. BK538]TCM81612.1 iron complex outermembrane receptor protein [Rhizobium sp. BK068]
MQKVEGFQGARRALRASVALIGLCAAWTAQAQTADTALAPIVVQGQSADNKAIGPVNGYVAKETTTGSKTDTPLNEIPQAVSVVGRQEMDDRGVVNKVDEALRYTPGVTAAPYGTDPDTDWFYIRGFNATQTGVFLDGLSLFSYGFGGFQIDPFMLERVEVLKGPASVLYGGSNPGGIVNMIRKRPTDEPYYYTETGINSNGNGFGGFDFSDKVGSSDTMSYRLTGKIAGGDNYSDFSHDLRGFIMPQLTVSPDASTNFTVWAYAGGLDQVHIGNGFLPYVGTVVDAPFGKIRRDFFPGEPDSDTGRYNQEMVGYELEHAFDNGWKLSSNFRYGHLNKYEFGPYPYGYVGGTPTAPNYDLLRIGFEGNTSADTLAFDNRVETDFELGGASHTVMAGMDYRYYRIDNVQNSLFGTTPISPVNPIYGLPLPPNNPLYNQVLAMNQLGFYAQDQIRFSDGWIATLNGRYDYVRSEMDDRLPANDDFRTSEGAWSGRAGLAYEFANGVTPYISAASFFNPLVGLGAQGPLLPEEGLQFEAGVKYEPTFMDATFTASVFHINKRNNVVSIAVPPWQDQLGEVRSQGVELEGKVNLNDNWKVLSSVAYNDVEVTRNDPNPSLVGKTPYIVPDVTASLWLDYTVTTGTLEGLSLGAGVRYKGESWADEANTLKVPDATLVDAAVRYKKNDWVASLNVTNIFDKVYVESCGGVGACGYGDARTFTFKLSKVW